MHFCSGTRCIFSLALTDENQDDMDCRPGPGDESIAVSDRIERLAAEKARREKAAKETSERSLPEAASKAARK